MLKTQIAQRHELHKKIRAMANQYRFRILELTQDRSLNITNLSSILSLSYTKCADYVRILEKEGLVEKTKKNKEVLVKSRVNFYDTEIRFR